jgi:ABC-2 type transport system permease protein
MDEAEALCDRVAVMRAGRIVDAGTPMELISRHAHSTTLTFTPPVSFDAGILAALPGVDRVERQGERIRVIGTNQLIAPVCASVLGGDGAPRATRPPGPPPGPGGRARRLDQRPHRPPVRRGRWPHPRRSGVMRALLRLATTELKLFVREPMVLTFVFAFPVLTVLILGGVFDEDDPNFEGALPSDYYIAAYIGVVIAAIGLVMPPVHLASYRERGVLRRFDVSRYPRWALPAAWIIVAMVITFVAVAVLLATGHLVYGLPEPDNPAGGVVGTLLGAIAFISIGIALGVALPSARSAQGLGMLLFFPFFLLGGAGPPPDAMGDPMSSIANAVPLTHVVRSIQEPWLDLGNATGHVAVLAGLTALATAVWLPSAPGPQNDRMIRPDRPDLHRPEGPQRRCRAHRSRDRRAGPLAGAVAGVSRVCQRRSSA